MFITQLPPINLVDNGATIRITLNNTIQYSHSFAPGTKPGDILLQKIFLVDTITPSDSFINDTTTNRVALSYCDPILSLIDMDARKETLVQSVEDTSWKVMPATYELPTSLTAFKAARGNMDPCVIVVESMIFNPNFPQCPAVPATLAEWQTYKANAQYSYFTVTYFRGVIT